VVDEREKENLKKKNGKLGYNYRVWISLESWSGQASKFLDR
jgi:hypothetical protein